MNKTIGHRMLSLLLTVAVLVGLMPAVFAASQDMTDHMPTGKYLISQTDYAIVPGVTESHIVMNDATGSAQVKGYMTTIEPGAQVEFKMSYSGYYTEGSTPESRAANIGNLIYDMKATTKQAADFEAATGRNVVLTTNGDYYNMQSGQPCGYLIMEGNVFQTEGSSQEPYFAVLKDGSYVIRDYGEDHSDVVEAISGPFYLVKDGKIAVGKDNTLAPRNSIGLMSDGTVVMFLADGRQGVSNGMTVYEVAEIYQKMGAVDALYLDGGGSATIASKHEGSDTLTIRNTPSDGMERVVASTLLLVSTAEGSGTFDHASLRPNNAMYIAGASVEFEASGVDTAGYPTDVPAGVTWALADESYGTMDATTGIFKSNGKTGTVTAQLKLDGTVVGQTSIEIREPEELYFDAESVNLAFKVTTDLGLNVRCQGRDVELGDVVLDWSVESLTEGVDASGIGSFEGNLFTTSKAKQTLNANITVCYTKADGTVMTDTLAVEIGKMPVVLFDFEPDENGQVGKGVAQYDWGKSGVAQYMPDNNPLTYLAWDDTADAPGMITNEGPFTFDGTYIDPDPAARDICYYPAASIFSADGYDFFTNHTSYMLTGSAAGDIVNAENGQVRFGDYALRWDYDYQVLNPGYKNVNMYLYTTESFEIEGTPTGLGMWVYAPEETDNFWLWMKMYYYDANGNEKSEYIHFKTQEGRSIQYNGIYWEGWMYVEADISHLAQYVTEDRPLHIPAGQTFLNITFIPGGSANENGDKIPMGSFTKGSIYVDNIRVVYGDTVDDMEKPEYTAITANGTELTNAIAEVTSNTVKLNASFYDPESDNATGILAEKTAVYVDGIKQTLSTSTEEGAGLTVTLPNGTHCVKFVISDGFGNVNTVTRYFRVNAKTTSYGSVSLNGEATAQLGKSYTLTLDATGYSKISQYAAAIALSDTFGQPTITFGAGYTGAYTYENGVLTLSATAASPATLASGTVATISFTVPADLEEGDALTYSVTAGSFTQNGRVLTFAQPQTTVAAVAAYELTADIMIVGGDGKIYVTKADGTAASKVQVYAVVEGQADQRIGTTNSAGVLVTNRFCQTVGERFTIYAKGADGLSFYYTDITTGLGSDEVTPTNVRLNAVVDSATTASVSWFSAPQYTEFKAVVQYVEKAAYDSGNYTFSTANGKVTTHAFASDNASSQVCSATITGLTPGTTYVYRVGDGVSGHWSELKTFTTMVDDADTTFFVIGDAQLLGNESADAAALAIMRQISDEIGEANTDFGLQTGDFIDDAGDMAAWNEILGFFSEEYGDKPIIQVMGNHEYYANLAGNHGEAIFNLPGEDYYSVEYGNVYVAVINCNANLEAAAKWLVEDAAQTDCEWKVLSVHQPPYYTNPKGSSAAYNQYLPSAVDAAGIDFVFSGHDHSYARTQPLTGGRVDEESGAVYFICGDLGEKSRSTEYAPVDDPNFHFATITQDYDAVYLIAKTSGNDMTVTAYNADGTVLDSYTMHHTTTCEDTGHSYVYDRETDTVSCSVCGETFPAYTGWIVDPETGKDMYFLGGEYRTGWFTMDTDLYHFDENGLAHKVTVVEDIPTSCDTRGHKTVECECGEIQTLEYGAPTGHTYVEITAEDGTVHYLCTKCGLISPLAIPFIDVDDGDWFAEAVEFCYEMDYIRGVTTVTFEPTSPITREQLATILWRIVGAPEPQGAYPFTDSCKSYAKKAITWAAENGIVKGYPDGTFLGGNNMTRQELVTMIYRFADYLGKDVTATADLGKLFSDAGEINEFAQTASAWAVAEGIVNGVKIDEDTTIFSPKTTATRAQVAAIIMRLMKGTGED